MPYIASFIFSLLIFAGCQAGGDQGFTPKPRMYPYVDLPVPEYEMVTEKSDCGFTFRKSVYANIVDRKKFFNKKLQNTCWFDLKYPDLEANIHFTYYPIGEDHPYANLVNESFQLVYEHSTIASGIEETPIISSGRMKGMAFTLKGPVASPFQFFLSDTTDHFLRAALYFNTRPNPDSIKPVLEYVRTDMDTLIESFQWQ